MRDVEEAKAHAAAPLRTKLQEAEREVGVVAGLVCDKVFQFS
jgi:hypothetical protein